MSKTAAWTMVITGSLTASLACSAKRGGDASGLASGDPASPKEHQDRDAGGTGSGGSTSGRSGALA